MDVSGMHRFSAKRGIGVYAGFLYKSLKNLAAERGDFQISLNKDRPARYDNFDVVHFPFFDLFFNTLPHQVLSKSVVTVHDVIPLRFKKWYPPGVRGSLRFWWQRMKLRWVPAVITDSKASKSDIVKLLKLRRERVFPVYLAGKEMKPIENRIKDEVRREYGLFDNYLLYVGDVNYHKNLGSLVRSLKYLPKVNLVMVGGGFGGDSVERFQLEGLIKKLGLTSRVKIISYVSDEKLATLYQLADFYIQPSLWEGFGLPVVEALSLGVPVIVSRSSSLREITDSTVAFYIKYPFNGKRIAEAIKTAYKNKSKVDKNGLIKFADRFSWDKTAWQTYQVYKKVYERQT